VTTIYRFGRFELQPSQRQLLAEGRPVTLGPRAFDLLLALVERRDRVVGKSELLDLVWPNVVVEENNLQVQVSTLRKLLGPPAIATIPGRGYRFTLPLEDGLAPAGKSLPHRLPTERTAFIGRERELADCARRLDGARLLTLTGVGGSGKTRIALKLAEQMLDRFSGRVWFVDLAPVDSEALVVETVATTLGAISSDGRSAEELIVEQLHGQSTLLVLDNCEHLLGPVSGLVDRLLGSLPEVKLLATSREGLAVDGESLFPVRSLGLPPSGELPDAAEIAAADAVRLFVARAQDGGAEFVLDGSNAAGVAEICRRLDGIPLAIELAAARTRALSVEQILGMLDDRFRLLTGGGRAMLERHRTLRTAVKWSYDQLTPEEQELFVALSVFTGGWTLDAAASVAGCDAIDLLDRMTRLIDLSMVVSEVQHDGPGRYRMLETLRQFGLELLAASGGADALRAAHLEYFLAWVESMKSELKNINDAASIEPVLADLDNLRAALQWGYQHEPLRAADLTSRLSRIWFVSGLGNEGLRWLAQALALGEALPVKLRALGLQTQGWLTMREGRYEESLQLRRAEADIHIAQGDAERAVAALGTCGTMNAYLGRHSAARACFDEALSVASAHGDPGLADRLDNARGIAALLGDDLVEARRHLTASLERTRSQDNHDRYQVALGNLALVEVAEGRAAAARELMRECWTFNREMRNLYGIAHDLVTLAEAVRLEGDVTTAAALIGTSDALMVQIKAKLEMSERVRRDRTVDALRAQMGDDAFEAARRDGFRMSWNDALALAGV